VAQVDGFFNLLFSVVCGRWRKRLSVGTAAAIG
jgi:hypothetical protein